MSLSEWEPRYCACGCGERLVRRKHARQLESLKVWLARKYASRACYLGRNDRKWGAA